jgi:hypothetical protein
VSDWLQRDPLEAIDEIEHLIFGDFGILFLQAEGFHRWCGRKECQLPPRRRTVTAYIHSTLHVAAAADCAAPVRIRTRRPQGPRISVVVCLQ